MDPSGRLVLVTGGAGAIGRAVARAFLRKGARVVLWDLDEKLLEEALRELSREGEARGHAVDVADPRAVAAAAERVRREAGEVDILDNNAAVVFAGDFAEACEADMLRTVDVNLNAVMWCTREFLPAMIRRGRGHVVMMASAAGLTGVPGMAVYAATKHAVVGLAESVRLELRRRGVPGVGITIVCPGFVRTRMFEGARPPWLMPWLEPEDVASRLVAAVESGRLHVREPLVVRLLPAVKALLGSRGMDLIGDLIGLGDALRPPGGAPPARPGG